MIKHIVLAVVAAASAVPAAAQSQSYVGTTAMPPATAFEQIRVGRLATAERVLVRQLKLDPAAPDLALNLAAVYQRTGRAALAEPLYRRVLALPAMAMDMPSGDVVSSHAVAHAGELGLRRTMASR